MFVNSRPIRDRVYRIYTIILAFPSISIRYRLKNAINAQKLVNIYNARNILQSCYANLKDTRKNGGGGKFDEPIAINANWQVPSSMD